jgi:predicted metal-binding membrane protein
MQPMLDVPSGLERLVRRDRVVVAAGLAAMAMLAWAYLLRMTAGMNAAAMEANMHTAMGMPEMRSWGTADLIALFLMWAVMMAAMMLPSAAPFILLVVGVYRRRGAHARGFTAAFVTGYLAAWTMFSMVAAAGQVLLHRAALLSSAMASRSTIVGGAILLVAGAYQWLPIKTACLTFCRSPLGFLSREWREGTAGAFLMGLRHGLFCVGCCWALMALLFVVGVMNLVWVAAIAAFVLLEKLSREGPRLGRAAGVLLIAWGTYLLVRGA